MILKELRYKEERLSPFMKDHPVTRKWYVLHTIMLFVIVRGGPQFSAFSRVYKDYTSFF